MSLSQRWSRSWFAKALRSFGNGVAGAGLLAATGAITAGCLDRPVAPATPDTTNIYIGQIRQTGVDKIDLLFMIDNSISMADKQKILAQAVPVLLERLIRPVCLTDTGDTRPREMDGDCPPNTTPEFNSVDNIHIGIITSSLGHHGSKDVCSDATMGRTPDDKAQLLPSIRVPADGQPPLVSWNGQGFLVWDPRGPDVDNAHVPPGWGSPGGPGNATDLVTTFATQVQGAGELGCGYEQQLESWYRFLIDPEPVNAMDNNTETSVRVKDGSGVTIPNTVVLSQRDAFLRRDSLLAIVMLTDENDCSILDEDGTQGWLVGYKGGPMANNWRMPASTQSCKADPNSACCRPCISGAAAGCPSNEAELCPANGSLTTVEDSMNQRCYNQMQRFGINLLYPTQRYVDAITQSQINPRLDGQLVQNPLFAPGPNGEPGREKGLVFLAGIIGVPWQDISTDGAVPVADNKPQPPNSLTHPDALVYLTASQLLALGRWDVILGDPYASPPRMPTDPLMIESIDPRPTGLQHPFVPSATIAAPGGAASNSINGREQAVGPDRDDLQFACIFELQDAVPCDATNAAGCDCNDNEYVKNSPLCQYGAADTDGTQVNAKAYPGLRELEVLKGVADAAIVASICPKNPEQVADPASDPYYGYNPAVAAIVERLKEALTAKCLPRPLNTISQDDVDSGAAPPEELGKVPCAVVESRPLLPGAQCGDCSDPGRIPLAGEKLNAVPAVKEYMANQGQCNAPNVPSCDDFCMCEIIQFTGPELVQCRTTSGAGLSGYCYVDPAQTEANLGADGEITPLEQAAIDGENELVASCKETERRVLRFLGDDLPAKDGTAVIACVGSAASAGP